MNPTVPDKLRVFLVEDTVDLREEIVFGLTSLGLDVSGFGDSAALYRALSVKDCDIVVIDIGLPGEDGFATAKHLRKNPSLGIVFLTARSSIDDRLLGLGLGADAYLIKPIDVRELAATLHALARRLSARVSAPLRTVAAVQPGVSPTSRPLANCWTLAPGDWALRNPQGAELTISEAERRFLKIMVTASGQVVEREKLIAEFAQDDDAYDPHRLDAVINRLRKRTELAGLGTLPLQSIRGTGYVFTA
jgi:two-component system response regulator PhoP